MKTEKLPGLYIHVPFCMKKCRYCDFFSVTGMELLPQWKESLCREAAQHAGFADLFGSLYLGGGTPSLLDLQTLEELTGVVRKIYDFAEDAEVTIELNPEDVTNEYIKGLAGLGFNRLSLGVQSFRDEELSLLGRRHSAARSKEALDICLSSEIDNVSIDLIFAISYQSLKNWEFNLRSALDYRPGHISCYEMTVKKGTELHEMSRNGEVLFPAEETQREMFLAASDILSESGYTHYEVSSYSLGMERMSRHNRVYWAHLPYLGLGPSAHSFKGSMRWWNSSSLDRYISCTDGEKGGVEELGFEALDREKVFLGLRTAEGIELELARRVLRDAKIIETLTGLGLLRVEGERLVPTTRGYLFSDYVAACFCSSSM